MEKTKQAFNIKIAFQSNIEEIQGKLEKLSSLLEEANSIMQELASKGLEVSVVEI